MRIDGGGSDASVARGRGLQEGEAPWIDRSTASLPAVPVYRRPPPPTGGCVRLVFFLFFSLLFLLNFVNFGYFGFKPEPNRKEPNRIFSVPISEKNRSVPVS